MNENRLQKQSGIKVIGFDSWTGGARHYERLLEAFKNKGIELSLIHIGSWGSDKGRESRERIGNLEVRDISSYARKSFPAILDAENASAVVFLSTDTFAHRAFNRYCRFRKLPTIWLFHGLRSVQVSDSNRMYKINLSAQVRFVSSRLLKALTLVWPTYALALWKTAAAPSEWMKFGRDILVFALGRYGQIAADDARTDMCCVYVATDMDIATRKYGFAAEHVVAVGNPDLIQFGLHSHLIGTHLDLPPVDRADVMYVDTGLVYTGNVFKSAKEFIQHLVETKEALDRQGKHLIFKPHPDHLRTNILSVLRDAGVEICSNKDFVRRLQGCCASIVEPSTVSLIPALIGMPVVLAKYGKLREQRYGKVLTSYPRSVELSDVGEFSSLIAAEQADCDAEQTKQWIDQNGGPLPAEEMPNRVANVLLDLITKSNGAGQGVQ